MAPPAGTALAPTPGEYPPRRRPWRARFEVHVTETETVVKRSVTERRTFSPPVIARPDPAIHGAFPASGWVDWRKTSWSRENSDFCAASVGWAKARGAVPTSASTQAVNQPWARFALPTLRLLASSLEKFRFQKLVRAVRLSPLCLVARGRH